MAFEPAPKPPGDKAKFGITSCAGGGFVGLGFSLRGIKRHFDKYANIIIRMRTPYLDNFPLRTDQRSVRS